MCCGWTMKLGHELEPGPGLGLVGRWVRRCADCCSYRRLRRRRRHRSQCCRCTFRSDLRSGCSSGLHFDHNSHPGPDSDHPHASDNPTAQDQTQDQTAGEHKTRREMRREPKMGDACWVWPSFSLSL